MAYEYEKSLKNRLLNLELDDYVEVIQLEKEYEELEEVYAKAKILNKIIDIVKTGRSLEDFGDVEVILLAIEHELNYMLEEDRKSVV